MRIAIVTPYADPEKGACVLRVNSFKNYFEKKGKIVAILAPKRKYVPEVPLVKRYGGIAGLIKHLVKEKYDVVIGTSPPTTHAFFALLTAKLIGKLAILDIRDPWTYAYSRLGIYDERSLKLKLYKLIEKFSYRLADKIFSVTPFTTNIIVAQGAKRDKIVFIPNGTVPEIFYRNEKEGKKLRTKLGIPKEAIVLLYAGAFVKKDLDKMLANLSEEIKNEDVWVLLLLSAEPSAKSEWGKIRRIISSTGINKKTILIDITELPYDQLYQYFSASDIGLNPLPDAMDYCIPAKTYDYLACGLPVLAKGPKQSALKNLVEKYNVGYYFSEWKALKKAFPEIVRDRSTIEKMRKRCIEIARKEFDRKISAKKALVEIERLMGKKN